MSERLRLTQKRVQEIESLDVLSTLRLPTLVAIITDLEHDRRVLAQALIMAYDRLMGRRVLSREDLANLDALRAELGDA